MCICVCVCVCIHSYTLLRKVLLAQYVQCNQQRDLVESLEYAPII